MPRRSHKSHWALIEAATLRLAVVVTVASAATVRVVGVAVRRVPLLRTATIRPGPRPRKTAQFCRSQGRRVHLCCWPAFLYHVGTACYAHSTTPVRTTPTPTNACARPHRAPVVVARALAVPGAVGIPVGRIPHADELGEQVRRTHPGIWDGSKDRRAAIEAGRQISQNGLHAAGARTFSPPCFAPRAQSPAPHLVACRFGGTVFLATA